MNWHNMSLCSENAATGFKEFIKIKSFSWRMFCLEYVSSWSPWFSTFACWLRLSLFFCAWLKSNGRKLVWNVKLLLFTNLCGSFIGNGVDDGSFNNRACMRSNNGRWFKLIYIYETMEFAFIIMFFFFSLSLARCKIVVVSSVTIKYLWGWCDLLEIQFGLYLSK